MMLHTTPVPKLPAGGIAAVLAAPWPPEQHAPDGLLYVPLVATMDHRCDVCGGTIRKGDWYWFGCTWMCDACRVREQEG